MKSPFFFFNADTDCPHYLLGWVRKPGMALEPSPERRSNMNTQTHRTCIRMSQEEYDLLKEKSRAARTVRQRLADERAGAKPPHALPGGGDESGHRLC